MTSTIRIASSSGSSPSLKRKLSTRNITDKVATTLPPRKVVRVMSALPDRLIPKKQQSQSPEQVLTSIMSKKGMATTLYAYDQVSFFEAHREEEINAYDFDVLKAIRTGDIEELRRFHESGRPLKCSNKFGESLLHLACRKALVPVVDFLLNEAGVPVQVVDDMGRSPLHDAFWTCEPNFELVDLIVGQCPDLLLVKDKRGHSPLNYARREHWGKWTEYLQSRSAILEPVCLNVGKQRQPKPL
jgi:hypothetical protein